MSVNKLTAMIIMINGATINTICKDGSGSQNLPSRCEKKSLIEATERDKKLNGSKYI
jgi:hypothetical protein